MTMYFFSQKASTLKSPENQTNYKKLQNIKTIDSKESQDKNTAGCFCNKEEESQKDRQEEYSSKKVNKNMAIVRLLNSSCNPIKTITAATITTFPSCLKHADVTPSHKKCNKILKANYRSVSTLPILSKVFERSMFF